MSSIDRVWKYDLNVLFQPLFLNLKLKHIFQVLLTPNGISDQLMMIVVYILIMIIIQNTIGSLMISIIQFMLIIMVRLTSMAFWSTGFTLAFVYEIIWKGSKNIWLCDHLVIGSVIIIIILFMLIITVIILISMASMYGAVSYTHLTLPTIYSV